MHKNIPLVVGITVLFLGTCITPSVAIDNEKKSTLPLFNGYIQNLIDNASEGDTIYIPSGTYYENIVINKSINLVGENRETTIIDGNRKGDVVFISADYVNISNFTIRNSKREKPYSGIRVVSDHNSISRNNILENYIGIRFENFSKYNIISCNNITLCDADGIELEKSNYSTITRNNITLCDADGIELYKSNYSTITRNIIFNNFWFGIEMDWANYNYITNNDIISNDDGICIAHSCNYNHIKNNYIVSNHFNGIVLLWDTNYNVVDGNNLSLNGNHGIYIDACINNTIVHNNITLNDLAGIYISLYSNNNLILRNNISHSYDGIDVWKSPYNTFIENNIYNNRYGIDLRESKSSIILNNSFLGNGLHVWDSYNNIVENNTVNNKPMVYFEEKSNKTITNAGQVILIKCMNITISNLDISNTSEGIFLKGTNYCTIKGNTISETKCTGIYIYKSNYNYILDNNIISNKHDGILIAYSDNNTIYHNNFINNVDNAVDRGSNIWDDGKFGNYWSNYMYKYPDAKKLFLKGIWDTPFKIAGGDNKDNCPLIWKWPNSRTRTIPRTRTVSYLWFLERFPLLEILLNIIHYN